MVASAKVDEIDDDRVVAMPTMSAIDMTKEQEASTPRELMLLRHAKAIRDDPGADDASRPLTPRGKAAASAMGRIMADRDLVPDRVLCSPAVRTRQTWELVAGALPRRIEVEVVSSLYEFGGGSALLEVIRTHGKDARRLLLIGHNPSMHELASRLVKSGNAQLRARLVDKFPTAALAVVALDLDSWDALTEGTPATLAHFIRPRDVPQ